MEERMIQLETLAALQDETIAQLNRELFRQQQDVSRLMKRLETLEQKMKDVQQPEQVVGNERPPHY